MKKAAIIFSLLLGVGCAHQGGPGSIGTERGGGTSIETSTGSTSVDVETSRDVEEAPNRPLTGNLPDESGPGTRGQSGINSPTASRTVTGQETNYLLNKDRGSVRSATDRFRSGGDYNGVDDSRGRIILTPGLDQGSAPEETIGSEGESLDQPDGAKSAPGLSDPPNSQPGDSVPRADAVPNSNQQHQAQAHSPTNAPAPRDELAGVRALGVTPYRSSSGSRFSTLGSGSILGVGRGPMSVSGSGSGFSVGEIRSGTRSVTTSRFGTLSSDIPTPGLSTALSPGRETSFGPRGERAANAYSDDPQRRVGANTMATVGTAAGTDLTRGLPIEALRNIDIISNGGQLTLRGTVGSDSEKINIENRLKESAGLTTINNQLTVSPGQTLPGESQISPGESRDE